MLTYVLNTTGVPAPDVLAWKNAFVKFMTSYTNSNMTFIFDPATEVSVKFMTSYTYFNMTLTFDPAAEVSITFIKTATKSFLPQ